MGVPASSTIAEIYMQVYERTVITMALHPAKVWERFHDDVYSILKRKHLENLFHHINNHHQNIKFIMKEESNRELAFLDSFSSREWSLYWYIGSLHKLNNTYTTALTTKQVAGKCCFVPI